MSLQLTVRFDSPDPEVAGAFWAGLLGRHAVTEPEAVVVPGGDTQVSLRFARSSSTKDGPNRLHLHVTSSSADEQRRIVDTVESSGGRRRGTGPLPFGRILYLSDPDGDEFCLIEPGNRYLDGCGPLGEVTCDGSVECARFWRDVLGWVVVWDEGEQIAIQPPEGGTKIGWDRWPAPAPRARDRQRFELTTDDPVAEAGRLVAVGASPPWPCPWWRRVRGPGRRGVHRQRVGRSTEASRASPLDRRVRMFGELGSLPAAECCTFPNGEGRLFGKPLNSGVGGALK